MVQAADKKQHSAWGLSVKVSSTMHAEPKINITVENARLIKQTIKNITDDMAREAREQYISADILSTRYT